MAHRSIGRISVLLFSASFLLSFLILTELRAQSSAPKALVDSLMREEIAKYPNGEWLMHRSDVFERQIFYLVKERLSAMKLDRLPDGSKQGPSILSGVPSSNFDISNDIYGQNETAIAISRKNSKLVIVGANDESMGTLNMPAYVTTNSGASWQTVRLPLPPNNLMSFGDPSIAASNDGNIYYSFCTTGAGSTLLVGKTLNGFDWSYCTPSIPLRSGSGFADKECITVDNSPQSPHFGRVYLSWTQFSRNFLTANVRLVSSDDQGNTWSSPVIVFDSLCEYSQVRTGKYGEVFVSFSSYFDTAAAPRHYFAVSTNGGLSFDVKRLTPFVDFPRGYWSYLKGITGPRAFPYSTFQVDLSTNRIYVVFGSWHRWPNGDSSAMLYRTYSDDVGATWRKAVPLGGSESSLHFDRFCPWVAYDQSSNVMSMYYYSSERDKQNILTWPYRAQLGPDGSFGEMALKDSSFDPRVCAAFGQTAFIGDYAGSDAFKGSFAAAWTENRKGFKDGDIYASVITGSPGANQVKTTRLNSQIILASVEVSPESSKLRVNFELSSSGPATLSVYDMRGIRLMTPDLRTSDIGVNVDEIDISRLPTGSYVASLSQSGQSQSKPFTIVR